MHIIREKARGPLRSFPGDLLTVVERLGHTQRRLSRRLGRVLFLTAVVLLLNIAAIVYSAGHPGLIQSAVAGADSAHTNGTGAGNAARKGA